MNRSGTLALLIAASTLASPAAAETLRMAYATAPISIDPYPYSDSQTSTLR